MLNGPPTEGLEIPCRWCEGYARFVAGEWIFKGDDSPDQQVRTLGNLIDHPDRQARIAEILGKPQP